VLTPPSTTAGDTSPAVVVALDASNHIATSYTGTVTFSSSTDSTAALPDDYTFTAADRGIHAISATLNTTGAQTVTATDTADSSLTATATVRVAALPPHFPGRGHGWW
jgi:adhesin/invasin